MKTLKLQILSLGVLLSVSGQAQALELNLIDKIIPLTKTATYVPVAPLRFAKMRARVISTSFNGNPSAPGHVSKDVCILTTNAVPVVDLRGTNQSLDILPSKVDCIDSDNGNTITLYSALILGNTKIIDTDEDIKAAAVILNVSTPTSTAKIPGGFYSGGATKDLNQKNFIFSTPSLDENMTCTNATGPNGSIGPVACTYPTPIYYTAIFDIED